LKKVADEDNHYYCPEEKNMNAIADDNNHTDNRIEGNQDTVPEEVHYEDLPSHRRFYPYCDTYAELERYFNTELKKMDIHPQATRHAIQLSNT